jgi:rusticyanin
MMRNRVFAAIGAVVLVGGVLGIGLAVAGSSQTTSDGTGPSGTAAGSSYSYYESMMGRFGTGSMMGGSDGSKGVAASYAWMMGGTTAPGWMTGGSLPNEMMGSNRDPGEVMGRLFANAPGIRVNSSEATRLGNVISAGAVADAENKRITFSGGSPSLVVVASPSGGPEETFRIAGMVNPTVTVQRGARVSIEVVNADPGTAHGLVVTANGSASSWMPMMTSPPAFTGAAVWFLGEPTSAGMHTATISFSATRSGKYQYLCAVPGHAQKGMFGSFVVAS